MAALSVSALGPQPLGRGPEAAGSLGGGCVRDGVCLKCRNVLELSVSADKRQMISEDI